MPPTDPRAPIISGNASVSLSLLITAGAVIVPMILGYISMTTSLTRIESRLDMIEVKQAQQLNDRWSRSEMRAWATLIEATNPELEVPDIN